MPSVYLKIISLNLLFTLNEINSCEDILHTKERKETNFIDTSTGVEIANCFHRCV